MHKGRLIALATAATLSLGSLSTVAFTAPRDLSPANLPVLLRHGALYMTANTVSQTGPATTDSHGRSLFIVQFRGPVRDADKQALTALGAELGDYMPENAFLVRMDASLQAKVRGLGVVKGVAVYRPELKLDQKLAHLAPDQPVTVRVSTFGEGTGAVKALSTVGARPDAVGDRAVTATLKAGALQSLAASADVVYVEPAHPNAVFNEKAAGVMNVPNAWSAGLDGKGQIVAITDTGLDNGRNDATLHPDFQGQVRSLIALGRSGDASDTLGHGTHVAGSILGTGAASGGQFKGMAPGAKLIFQSVADSAGGLGGIPSDLTQLFKQAYDGGARIHSNSWGVPVAQGGAVYGAQSAAVDRFVWEHPDDAILFAAGNDGDPNRTGSPSYGSVTTPGTAKNAITVGASQNNRPDKKMGTNVSGMTSFSSRGPTGDNRVKPDLVAPGSWILSTRSSLAQDKEFWANYPQNSRYGYMGGTSMATPLTAGATALVRQFYVDKLNVKPRAALLKATLINGAAAMDAGLSWKDVGWGRVDLNNSLYARPFKFVNEEKALTTGDVATYSYTVGQGQPLKVTLAWTDYPASPSADKTLVNDLDLAVKGPDGATVLGNQMLANGADRINNVENVVVNAPQAGTYTVTVKGYNVPQGPQRFAMVVSGSVAGGTVPTPPQDQQSPAVAINTPADGATVSGTVRVTAAASDNVGVTKVLYYVDGQEAATVTTAPWALDWDSTRVGNGTHSLVANAYDAAGNVGISKAVHVAVSN